MPLEESRRKQLAEVITKMEAAGEPTANIQLVVDHFKSKYNLEGGVAERATRGVGEAVQGTIGLVGSPSRSAAHLDAMDAAIKRGDKLEAATHAVRAVPVLGGLLDFLVQGHEGSVRNLNEADKAKAEGDTAGRVLHDVRAIPVVGPMVESAADKLRRGDIAGVIGNAVGAYAIGKAGDAVARNPGAVMDTMANVIEAPLHPVQAAKMIPIPGGRVARAAVNMLPGVGKAAHAAELVQAVREAMKPEEPPAAAPEPPKPAPKPAEAPKPQAKAAAPPAAKPEPKPEAPKGREPSGAELEAAAIKQNQWSLDDFAKIREALKRTHAEETAAKAGVKEHPSPEAVSKGYPEVWDNPEQQGNLDMENVAALEKGYRAGENIPPIVVREDGMIIEGHHRNTAAKKAGVSPEVIRVSNQEFNKMRSEGMTLDDIEFEVTRDWRAKASQKHVTPPPSPDSPLLRNPKARAIAEKLAAQSEKAPAAESTPAVSDEMMQRLQETGALEYARGLEKAYPENSAVPKAGMPPPKGLTPADIKTWVDALHGADQKAARMGLLRVKDWKTLADQFNFPAPNGTEAKQIIFEIAKREAAKAAKVKK